MRWSRWASTVSRGKRSPGDSRRSVGLLEETCQVPNLVMNVSHQADPPDVEADGRTVKCYLYQG